MIQIQLAAMINAMPKTAACEGMTDNTPHTANTQKQTKNIPIRKEIYFHRFFMKLIDLLLQQSVIRIVFYTALDSDRSSS